MLTRKSGILALVMGAMVLGACEKKGDTIIEPQPLPVSVTISGVPTQAIKKGQTAQLVAVVNNSTNQSVTWSVLSGSTVVSVSATGLVTALNPGVATVQAVSAADPNAKAAVSITVADTTTGGGSTPGQPSITINSVTQFGTLFPVNPGNVNGTIDVTMNVDIPAGVNASAVRVTVDGTQVCRQNFAAGSSADASIEAAPQTVVCSFNTAQLNANGTPVFLNGVHTLRAEVVGPTGNVLASATYQPLTFNNTDVVTATVTTSKAAVADQQGLSWRGGDVTVALVPSIYSGATNNVTSLTVSLNSSAAAAIQGTAASSTADFSAGCATTGRPTPVAATATCAGGSVTLTDADASNGFSVTFPAATRWALGGVGSIEDPNVTVTVNGLTAAGQNFAGNTPVVFAGNPIGAPNNFLRLDNLAPRVTLLDITPATLGCAPNAACYVNGTFAFTATNANSTSTPAAGTLANTVDYGVDRQTNVFAAGPSGTSLTTATNGSQLAETQVANTNLLSLTTTDALQNSRQVFASTTAAAPATSSTAANVQRFGVDLTPPTQTVSGTGNGVATAPAPGAANTFTFSASDAGVGPSAIKQFNVKVEQITPTGTTCLTPAGALFAGTGSCGGAAAGVTVVAAAGNPAAATVTLPDASAYYRITVTAQDFAGNTSTATTIVQLRDFVRPTVGGMATPSSIVGNTSVSFSAPMSDDVELGDILPTIGYTQNAVNVYLANPRRTIGTYGFDVFSNSDAGTFTVDQFIRSIETTAGNIPSGVISLATLAQADVRDVAGVQLNDACPAANAGDGAGTQNCFQREANITAAVSFGMNNAAETSFGSANRPFGTGVNNQGNFFAQTDAAGAVPAANTNACSNNPVGANAGCNVVTATTVGLFAQAKGPSQTFAAPFARLAFYAIDPVTGRAFKVCDAAAPTAVDNTVNNTRTWTYNCTWSVQTTSPNAAGVYQVFALGVDSTGRALMSQNRQVTLTSD